MLITVIAFFTFAYLSLNWITRHNKFTETPNIVGLNFKDVQRKYPDFNFHIDSTNYNQKLPPLTIVTQDPYPKEKIKHSRTIYLTVTPFMPSLKTVPLVYGKQLDRALAALKNSGFTGKILRFENDKADSTILKVLYINPVTKDSIVLGTKAGDISKLREGSVIHLVVARIGEEVPVPDLACNTYDAARFLLEGSELNVGNLFTMGIVSDTTNAYVVRQNPAFMDGRMAKKGQEIDIWLSASPPPNCGGGTVNKPNPNTSTNNINAVPKSYNSTKPKQPASGQLRVRTGSGN